MSTFWKPVDSVDRNDSQKLLVNTRNKHLPLSYQRQLLPISRFKNEILYAVETYRTVILVGETGCGKSTQIPQFLKEAGWASSGYCIVCTQPRRIAAITVSSRVSEEMGCLIGSEVGYSVRFDSNFNENTSIKYCTDGVLLRETLSDPLLSRYSVVMVDEAHERSLHSDILLGILKKILRKRNDFRVIVASAGMNAKLIQDFYETNRSFDMSKNTSIIMSVTGRMHHVDILYLNEPAQNYVKEAVETVISIHRNEDRGDVLVFLPSAEDIENAIYMLDSHPSNQANDLYILPLYSSLPYNLQQKVFDVTPPTHRKVVFATNIAETSITVEGVKFVVDSGFVKMNYFNPMNGVDALITCPASQTSALQRAGRAGRTQVGKCFRLMTQRYFAEELPLYSPPEMQRTDITSVVLQLKALAIDDVLHFDFLSPPPTANMIFALELLYALDALDGDGKLTRMGMQMAEMPLEPRMSKSLLSSLDLGCSEEILSIVAMCSVEYPFISHRAKASQESKDRLVECMSMFTVLEGDHLSLLKIFNEYSTNNRDHQWCDSVCLQPKILSRAKELRTRLLMMLKAFANPGVTIASCGEDTEMIRKCLVMGYFSNAAQLGHGGKYWTVRGRVPVSVHQTSIYARFGTLPEWVIFHDVLHTSDIFIREITKIEPRWLLELASHYYFTTGKR